MNKFILFMYLLVPLALVGAAIFAMLSNHPRLCIMFGLLSVISIPDYRSDNNGTKTIPDNPK